MFDNENLTAIHFSRSSKSSSSFHFLTWQDANRLVVLKTALRSKMSILKLSQKNSRSDVFSAKCSSDRIAGLLTDSILRSINP